VTESTFPRGPSAAALALVWLACGGCDHEKAGIGTTATTATQSQQATEVFKYAIGMLDDMDESDATPAERDEDSSNLALDRAAEKLLEGGTAATVVTQLNQWIASQKPSPDWRPARLLETLPATLRAAKTLKELESLSFPLRDGPELRQVMWLRGVAAVATPESTDDLDRAVRLFDWTIRNIQLESPESLPPAAAHLPWQSIVFGRGHANERAWVFALLARQQGLDVVMLARAAAHGDEPEETGLAALAIDGRFYLFDPRLGLPIPGPEGKGVATLDEAADDDALLRRLDLDSEHPYPLKSSDLDHVVAMVEASPNYLSQRMWMVESHLAGGQRPVLALDADDLARRLRACAHISDVRIWPFPYRRLREAGRRKRNDNDAAPLVIAADPLLAEMAPFVLPFVMKRKKNDKPKPVAALWRGRVLHLLGRFTGDEGANFFYQLSRPPDIDLEQQALRAVELAKALVQRGPEGRATAEQLVHATDQNIALIRRAKEDASYWLGLAAFERAGREQRRDLYETAIDYFSQRTLAATPGGPWTHGAEYNLARTYEALGRSDEARRTYRQDEDAPQHHGNMLRARWLEGAAP